MIDTVIAHTRIAKAKYQGLRYKPRYSNETVSNAKSVFPWIRMRGCTCTIRNSERYLHACSPLQLSRWSMRFWVNKAIQAHDVNAPEETCLAARVVSFAMSVGLAGKSARIPDSRRLRFKSRKRIKRAV